MKYLIASDIHGSFTYCEKLVDCFVKEGADRLILLGDLLYHGPRNPLPEGYAPDKVYALLNGLKGKICAVRGNCDSEVDQMVLDFNISSDFSEICDGKFKLTLSHGHRTPPPLKKGDVYITGHTHEPLNIIEKEGYLHLNPGSVSLPKDGRQTRGYILYENGSFTFKTLDGVVYDAAILTL